LLNGGDKQLACDKARISLTLGDDRLAARERRAQTQSSIVLNNVFTSLGRSLDNRL